MGDYLQGDLALQRAIENDPQEPTFLLLSLRRRLMKGEFDAVEQSLRRLQEKYPLKLEVLQLRASLETARGDYETAEQLLRQARVTHKSPLVDFSLARIYYLQRKYRSVLSLTTPLLDQLSGSWEVVYLHTLSLASKKSWKDALEISKPYLNNPESRGFAHRLVGDLYLYQGNESEAQKIYQQGLENHPDHLFLIEALSASMMVNELWEENQELLVNTLEKNEGLQSNPALHLVLLDRLALTLQQLGKKEEMRLVMREYHLRNDPMLVNQMFSMEEQLLFLIALSTVGPEWLFLPENIE
jgi:tetratricopeptide (TPR) repeat protein